MSIKINEKETSIDELKVLLKGGYVHTQINFSTFITKKLYQYEQNYYFAVEYAKNSSMITTKQKVVGRKDLLEIISMFENFDLKTEKNLELS
jgi:hypothetical protein